ncbi:asparagine synthetase [Thermococcus piezophilus]|uniref:Asparagine synthetase n=2 Tax=Thermococcus piezophilus TaxID=1712654 RepID=A0A172WH92_9EURY|nr:asparagine synthetase [Thermococcus piezophilus]
MNALQLVTRKIEPIMEVQTRVIEYMTRYMVDKGFKWMLPVMLSSITDPLWPDPEAEKMLRPPEIEVYGERLRLTHSMILHKQMVVAMGIDKLFILSPNIRLEGKSADDGRHAYEFTQLDMEMAHASMDDVMSLIEGLIAGLFKEARSWGLEREIPRVKTPFKRFTLDEITAEFGSEEEASKAMDEPFWITGIPREFYDREVDGQWRNYDLYLPGGYGEVSSGGEREWEYEVIVRKMKKAGISLEAFRPYLEVAKAGLLRPSAGAGIGVERLLRYMVGAEHIAEVQPFPRIPGIPAVI